MSELIQSRPHADPRLHLLATASALSLLAAIAPATAREDANRPTVWIELGGQLEALSNTQDQFAPPFLSGPPPLPARPWGPLPSIYGFGTQVDPGFADPFAPVHPLAAQSPPHQAFGGEAKLSFQPDGSDWIFAASMRYGRATGHKSVQRNVTVHQFLPDDKYTESLALFDDARGDYTESHAVLDFQVGRDVGLGLFGRHASSQLNFGVRFAQLATKSAVRVDAIPSVVAYRHDIFTGYTKYSLRFQSYTMRAQSERSFHGIGPSLSWNGSAPLIGDPSDIDLALDWGVNGALLFGRQKAEVTHHTVHHDRLMFHKAQSYDQDLLRYDNYASPPARSKAVTVPNIGAFAGMSVNFPNAKVSLGYRADFFFGAMDAGIDARRAADMSFHGPFAKISVGLGG